MDLSISNLHTHLLPSQDQAVAIFGSPPGSNVSNQQRSPEHSLFTRQLCNSSEKVPFEQVTLNGCRLI